MRILYLVNNCFVPGNGLSSSARRTVKGLREAGLDVRIMSQLNPESDEKPDYVLKHWRFPVFESLIRKQGYAFAATDYKLFEEAVEWADIIHLEEPFKLERNMAKVVEKHGKVLTATYHLHTENLYCSIHMGWSRILNNTTMRIWRGVFNKCSIIQCPTENAKERLVRWNYKPELRVISNGMIPHEGLDADSPICASDSSDGTFTVVTTGRYSVEKDQITLLKAMKYSKYADRIRLVILGRGPIEKKLRKRAKRLVSNGTLKYEPEFGFHSLDELEAIYRKSDLYIHCATIEVEGLSCMEAIELGLVPIIATGDATATAQYALSEKSKYPARDARALAERIDWWLEHDAERRQEARKYLGMGARYNISKSIEQLVNMYQDALGRR